MLKNYPKKTSYGFSLIELLAAIAVVAILATVLLPTISAVRMRGLKVKSSQNLRELGTAMNLYMLDSFGHFPASENRNSNLFPEWQFTRWLHALDGYLDAEGHAYKLAKFHSPRSPNIGNAFVLKGQDEGIGVYGYNNRIDDVSSERGIRYERIAYPSRVIVLGEKRYDTATGPHLSNQGLWPQDERGLADNYDGAGIPILWADWSVSIINKMPPPEAFQPELID